MSVTLSRSLNALFVTIPLLWAGCGDDRFATFPVSGTVRFEDGQPVPHGVVEFRSDMNGLTSRAKLDQEGRFTLGTFTATDGAPAGNYSVIVVQHFDVPPRPNNPSVRSATVEHDHKSQTSIRLAPEFSNYSTTRLNAKVKPNAKNEFNFVVNRYPAGTPGQPWK